MLHSPLMRAVTSFSVSQYMHTWKTNCYPLTRKGPRAVSQKQFYSRVDPLDFMDLSLSVL